MLKGENHTKKATWKKLLHDRRCRKYGKRKHKKTKRYFLNKVPKNKDIYTNKYVVATPKRYITPKVFSLINNANETIEYFNELSEGILKKFPRRQFLIDSSDVESVTVDALIYLIAIMENMKLNKTMQYRFSGNWPQCKQAEIVYKDSGFVDYVQSKSKAFPANKSKVKIRSGINNDPRIAQEISDFVISELDVKIKDIIFIQKILGELMSNAFYHAYDDKTKEMYSKWYLYAEHVEDKIRIIFADTGRGIARTIRRKKSEKVKEFIFGLKDEDLLYHAFQPGNFIRTETKESYRGNGLPGIKAIVEDSPISSFWVFSGKGGLCINKATGTKQLTKHGYLHRMYGTMVVFEFSEGGIQK